MRDYRHENKPKDPSGSVVMFALLVGCVVLFFMAASVVIPIVLVCFVIYLILNSLGLIDKGE